MRRYDKTFTPYAIVSRQEVRTGYRVRWLGRSGWVVGLRRTGFRVRWHDIKRTVEFPYNSLYPGMVIEKEKSQ